MNKFSSIIFIIFISIVDTYAERWPFDVSTFEYVYSHYEKFSHHNDISIIPTTHIVSQGSVYASTDARVIMAGNVLDTNTDENMLILKTGKGFYIAYYGISPMVSIGKIVRTGDIVGTTTSPWYIRIFDVYNNRWGDPFDIFPVIDIPVEMKLYDFSFKNKEKSNKIFSVSDKIIQAGNNTVNITLSILEKKSRHYTIPQYIQITLQDITLKLWRNDIIQSVDIDVLNEKNLIVFSIPDLVIKKGYFILNIFIYHSKIYSRNFKFSLRAK